MATENIAITKTWTKIASDVEGLKLASVNCADNIEFATTATDVAPTVVGHIISELQGISRDVLGEGFVWARISEGAGATSSTVIVSK